MKKENKSLVGPAGAALIVFTIGCGLIIAGLASSSNGLMLAGAVLIVAGGGLAALMGDKISEEFIRSQGGGAARRARDEADRTTDRSASDLTLPEDWSDPPKPGS